MAIDYSILSGTEYQKQIFKVLIDEIFKDPRVLVAENHERGAVDYVVRERQMGSILDTDRIHYFECKNYSRTLELNDVAKFMIIAVVDKPLSANLVSSTALQPQVMEYASRIFSVVGAESTNPQFANIHFRHWKTDSFSNKNLFQAPPSHGEKNIAKKNLSWWLTECSAFSETAISSFQSSDRQLSVTQGTLLLLRLYLPESYSNNFTLPDLPQKCWVATTTPPEKVQGQHRYLIDTAWLEPGNEYIVSVGTINGTSDGHTPLCRILINDVEMPLPELRVKEIAKLSAAIGPSGSYRLVLIDGEAGVGKTHLIEKVAEGLRAKAGFDVIRFTVQEENCDVLMKTVLRSCLAPPIENNAFEELTKVIEQTLLSHTDWGNIEMDFGLLVRAASRMGNRIVVLRDCHLVTSTLAEQIWKFISALDDTSWGGIRLVLEYRQPDGLANIALQKLIKRIHLNIRKVLHEEKVKPITRERFSIVSKEIFSHITLEIAQCLHHRTGGLPLFLTSYMRQLINIGAIKREAKGRQYTITQPARLLAESLPEGGKIILVERVQICMKDKFGSDWHRWMVTLGLIAVGGDLIGQKLICKAMSLSNDELLKLRYALEDAEIGYGCSDGSIVFRHDLLREAVIFTAISVNGFSNSAREMISNLLQNTAGEIDVRIHAIRIRILGLIKDNFSLEIALRIGLKFAKSHGEYGWYIIFLNQILELLKDRVDLTERFDFMSELAWATWVSDSLWVARERYRQLAEEAEQSMGGDFSIYEDIATDAYRRALGIDIELVEPLHFLKNTISTLLRRQSYLTFNSIMNRIVLFCARFGFPTHGYKFAELAFNYIGRGDRDNEGSVLCSELGSLYASCAPEVALSLFKQALAMAMDATERACNDLEIFINECLYQGKELELRNFSKLWHTCAEGQFSETLTRASLLRGALLLRDRDMDNAGRWLERTATMVQVYRMKQFEIAVTNDQIIYDILLKNWSSAKKHLKILCAEFKRVEDEVRISLPLVEQVWEVAFTAAKKLPILPSPIKRPKNPPVYCDPLSEIRWNISVFKKTLDQNKTKNKHQTTSMNIFFPPVSVHRTIEFQGDRLILGAY